MKLHGLLVPALLILAAPLGAQQDESEPTILARGAQEILAALNLPRVAEEIRDAGVPSEEVARILEATQQQGMEPDETLQVLESSAEMAEEHGPVDNFGAFVQSQLDAGLRGRELAAAIRAEHEVRGIGKGEKLERRPSNPAERGSRGRGRNSNPDEDHPGDLDGDDHREDGEEHDDDLDGDRRRGRADKANWGTTDSASDTTRRRNERKGGPR